jgi:hypothetical protein
VIRTTAALTLALALPAGAFELQQPVDCTLGETCYIQQYFDHDPGPGSTDFSCGPLAYDGHNGTDFALPTRQAMQAGVAVQAAASGRVARVRDGVDDFAPVIPGKECGNAVVLDHGWGWETQYCHLKKDSISVKPGDLVSAGTQLGMIGQSGAADFPHLHLSVRHDGIELDPFSPEAMACGAAPDDLWAEDVPFQPGGLLDIGITTVIPEYSAIKSGLISADLPTSAPALVVWAYYFGPQAGDVLTLALSGPEGEVFAHSIPIEKTQALAFRAGGRKLKTGAWPPGLYEGTATLNRDGTLLDRMQISITVGP